MNLKSHLIFVILGLVPRIHLADRLTVCRQCLKLIGIVGNRPPAIGAQFVNAGFNPVKPAIVIGRHDLAGFCDP